MIRLSMNEIVQNAIGQGLGMPADLGPSLQTRINANIAAVLEAKGYEIRRVPFDAAPPEVLPPFKMEICPETGDWIVRRIAAPQILYIP
jgi:hypothetical protein